jgi:hypothetical protein
LDPTEIIAVPFPLESLGYYVGITFTMFFLVSIQWWNPMILMKEVINILLGTLVSFSVLLLCGADPMKNTSHTLWSSLYLMTLVWLNPFSIITVSDDSSTDYLYLLLDISQHPKDVVASSRLYGTLLVAIPVQLLNILDWGSQVQRWPLPVLIGSTYGWIVGTIVGVVIQMITTRKSSLSASKDNHAVKKT